MTEQITIREILGCTVFTAELLFGSEDTPVASVSYNSLKVTEGALFVAVKGFTSDGHDYIDSAVENGAACIVLEDDRKSDFMYLKDKGTCLIAVSDTRAALSYISAMYYGFPTRDMIVAGITGTNGKTSITYILEAMCREAGIAPGVIGTVNYRWKETVVEAPNTTPESSDLQEMLSKMRDDGVQLVIMEVSSHSLVLKRVNDIDFNFAVFTNLTRDHLDFHENFENYFEAKKELFRLLDKSPKKHKAGFVNLDDEYGQQLFGNSYSYPLYGYGFNEKADYRPDKSSVSNTISGLRYSLRAPREGVRVDMKLSGNFQVYNSLAALAVADQAGMQWDTIVSSLRNMVSVPGRLELVESGADFGVVVDYAHTDDALKNVLTSAKELAAARLITVFGCGGDRDKTKRPLMAGVSESLSDFTIVTSDNPRTEDPEQIVADVAAGLQHDNHTIIIDREEAIKHAIGMAGTGDIVVIAGKGHEDYQIIGKKKIHFDDREIAAKYINERIAAQ